LTILVDLSQTQDEGFDLRDNFLEPFIT